MGALDYAGDNKLPLFANLTWMGLHVHNCYGWKRLLLLFNSMPNLVYLDLTRLKNCEDNALEDFNFIEQEVVPCCLSMHLQKIGIRGFRGLSDELKLTVFSEKLQCIA